MTFKTTPKRLMLASLNLGLFGTLFFGTSTVKAQDQASWSLLKKADARIAASHINWAKVVESPAVHGVDLKKYRAKRLDEAKQKNLTSDETQVFIENSMRLAQSEVDGSTYHSTKEIWHQGKFTRADAGNAERIYAVNFSDGQNLVTIDTSEAKMVDGKTAPRFFPTRGILVRNPDDAIQYTFSRFGDLIFLAGKAVTDEFDFNKAKLAEADGNLVLEQKVQSPRSPQGMKAPLMARLSVSKKTMRPTGMDVFIIEPNRTRLFLRYTPSEVKTYPGGVQFPSHLKVEAFNGKGTINFTEDYQITRAAFNKAADLTDLKVPPGTYLGDVRFGSEASVSYTIDPKGTLPSDDQVRAMLKAQGREIPTADKIIANDKSDKEMAAQEVAQREAPTPSSQPRSLGVLALSALFVLSGLALWTRSKHI